jgi:Mg2+ and Co2+ transporter CorA
MKRLAAWAAIIAVPTMIAGVYGMNFKFMPELEWSWGYPVTMIVMVGACGFLYYRFRRAGLALTGERPRFSSMTAARQSREPSE